ncbi:hypothetical protein SPRG_02817 [Saprolegnia parasitica CBS 223.65]|uniref:FYVE-type domain-containing protein n=1 Tax=Saprolegnia parasitica (strain CBS 223.65) TaxID=695850 RepID=A0A067CPB8_SAPPC|nr:hypothetical protein SPRG_02817 [Saprolegnia parasitica CBS 223.65]KDO32338.1 hypothetical protein SPRG_02817 [Saprolegnia parasitica CBS 223.65]|eukprot:XP_012196794.1 hypothetical protein SPRG_02817 [Saprolegnia parasitica CBS 223.65]
MLLSSSSKRSRIPDDVLEFHLKHMNEWVADRDRPQCVICIRRFNTFVRKHHCRACGEVVCSQCSLHRHVRDVLPRPSLSAHHHHHPQQRTSSIKNATILTVRICMDCIGEVQVYRNSAAPPTLLPLSQSHQSTNSYSFGNMEAEETRLLALSSFAILDTTVEAEYNAVCQAAAKTFGCSVAAIGFLDGMRQWYKASLGIAHAQLPRELALCTYLIENRMTKPLVVRDLTLDKRFAENPLVTGPAHIRFYVAVPIVTMDGQVIGTIMVLDTAPRDGVDARAVDMLVHLSSIVMEMLEENRRRERNRLTAIEECSIESGGSSFRRNLSSFMGRTSNASADTFLQAPPEPSPIPEVDERSPMTTKKATESIVGSLERHKPKLVATSAAAVAEQQHSFWQLLSKISETQQLLAEQQNSMLDKLSQQIARIDRLEDAMGHAQDHLRTLKSQVDAMESDPTEYITI